MVSGTLKKTVVATSATHLLIDASGSMSSRWDTTIGSGNEFISAQKIDNPGSTIIITTFDYHNNYVTVYNGLVEDAPELNNVNMPCTGGMTALLDSTVRALNDLKATGAERRQLATITDGGENASKEYAGKGEVVKGMLETARQEGIDVVALAVGEASWENANIYGNGNTILAAGSAAAYTSGIRSLSARSVMYNSSADVCDFAANVATVASIDVDGNVKP